MDGMLDSLSWPQFLSTCAVRSGIVVGLWSRSSSLGHGDASLIAIVPMRISSSLTGSNPVVAENGNGGYAVQTKPTNRTSAGAAWM